MAKPVDQELKKAFSELSVKMQDTAQKLKYADVQIQGLKMSKGLSESTLKEISAFPPDINVYESVGRMFLLTEIPEVVKHLKDKSSSCEEKIKGLEKNKEYLENSLKDFEDNIREMVRQKKCDNKLS